MSKSGTFGGTSELTAAARVLNVRIVVFEVDLPPNVFGGEHDKMIELLFTRGDGGAGGHYSALRRVDGARCTDACEKKRDDDSATEASTSALPVNAELTGKREWVRKKMLTLAQITYHMQKYKLKNSSLGIPSSIVTRK